MKKFISMLSVVLVLVISASFCLAARDTYVCTDDKGRDVYVDTDSIKGWPEEYQVIVTIGKARILVAFVSQGGITMYGVQGGETGFVSPGSTAYKIHMFCKSRVKSIYTR